MLTGVFGRDIPEMGGPLEGLVLGATTGIGYAIATRRLPQGGMAAPRGRARWRVAAITGLAAAIGAVALALAGGHLVGSSLDLMASAFAGSQVGLEPLARLLGEEHLRPVTRMVVSGFEGVLFGSGLAFGLTIRPRRPAEPAGPATSRSELLALLVLAEKAPSPPKRRITTAGFRASESRITRLELRLKPEARELL